MANPFKTVTCAMRYDNARVLNWTFDSSMDYPSNFILQVENSRSGGPWTVLASDVKDNCFYIDTRRRNYNKYMNESYRLRLILPDTNEEYVSEVCDAGTVITYPFSTESSNALKQIETSIKMSGCTGVLLKKKSWGVRCPLCTDFEGQASVNEHCPKCLGTGIVGGYYNGISLDIVKDKISDKEQISNLGFSSLEVIQGRCIAYPWICLGDIWCEDHTNYRYYITEADTVSAYKTTPLVYSLQLHRIEYTDVLYTEPVDDKVNIKDVWDSSLVTYTPEMLEDIENKNITDWDEELSKL